jgi:hypothetical protein
VTTLALPVTLTTSAAPDPAITCPILHLAIGAINLNLLGLVITINPITIDIVAVPGQPSWELAVCNSQFTELRISRSNFESTDRIVEPTIGEPIDQRRAVKTSPPFLVLKVHA